MVNSNAIAKTCLNKFDSLPKSGKPGSNQWTVLSCIVQEENGELDVVALGTGSKCIGCSKMSPKGDILNDSHAEVICRRAFLVYLYKQMDRTLLKQTSVFNFNSEIKKFRLKSEVRFHFFTTMVPCGDASIFPKCDGSNSGDVVIEDEERVEDDGKKRRGDFEEGVCKRFKNESRDIHRTGAKCLKDDERQDPKEAGARYHVTGVVRTKPGRGDPTLSVSCSDKITKWCHLGLQGNLLSIFLEEPFYLTTFTVVGNTNFSQESLQRSFFDRIANIEMTSPFEKKPLQFCHATDTKFDFQKNDSREVCPSSIIWYKEETNRKPEVAVDGKKQGITKKNRNLESSRLKICKAELFKLFKCLHQRLLSDVSSLTYKECKEKASKYQMNWKVLKSSLGAWPVKNDVLLEFK